MENNELSSADRLILLNAHLTQINNTLSGNTTDLNTIISSASKISDDGIERLSQYNDISEAIEEQITQGTYELGDLQTIIRDMKSSADKIDGNVNTTSMSMMPFIAEVDSLANQDEIDYESILREVMKIGAAANASELLNIASLPQSERNDDDVNAFHVNFQAMALVAKNIATQQGVDIVKIVKDLQEEDAVDTAPEERSSLSTPASDKTISVSDVQSQLLELAQLNNNIGIDLGSYGANKDGIDGIQGTMTTESIVAAQAYFGLDANGVVDQVLMDKLNEEILSFEISDVSIGEKLELGASEIFEKLTDELSANNLPPLNAQQMSAYHEVLASAQELQMLEADPQRGGLPLATPPEGALPEGVNWSAEVDFHGDDPLAQALERLETFSNSINENYYFRKDFNPNTNADLNKVLSDFKEETFALKSEIAAISGLTGLTKVLTDSLGDDLDHRFYGQPHLVESTLRADAVSDYLTSKGYDSLDQITDTDLTEIYKAYYKADPEGMEKKAAYTEGFMLRSFDDFISDELRAPSDPEEVADMLLKIHEDQQTNMERLHDMASPQAYASAAKLNP